MGLALEPEVDERPQRGQVAPSPIVDNPTTGVIVDGGLVFMARRNRERVFMGGDPATLGDIVIARVPLPIAR